MAAGAFECLLKIGWNGYVDKMKSLGLYGGKERLPSLAFNTKSGSQIPFPENLPINRETGINVNAIVKN